VGRSETFPLGAISATPGGRVPRRRCGCTTLVGVGWATIDSMNGPNPSLPTSPLRWGIPYRRGTHQGYDQKRPRRAFLRRSTLPSRGAGKCTFSVKAFTPPNW